MSWEGYAGTKRMTADGIVGVGTSSVSATTPAVRVYECHWLGAGTFVLRNGSNASGDIYFTGRDNKNTGEADLGGMLFPQGCFYDHDSGITYATINFRVTPE